MVWAIACFWCLNLADGALTALLLYRPGARELNPLVALLATQHALIVFWSLKGAACIGMTLYLLGSVRWHYKRLAWRLTTALSIVVALAVLFNMAQLLAG